jgi:hypothetical protein
VSGASEQPISKSEFARRRNVVPGRVTQWISAKKIDGAALVGEGRSAQIVESVAIEQLRQRLDITQRFGNGLDTRLPPAAAASNQAIEAPPRDLLEPAAPVTPQPTARPPERELTVDPVDEKIKRERLEQIQRANRRAAIEEAAETGRLVGAEGVAKQMGRLASQMVTVFEGSLTQFANAIAAKFSLPQRDVLHLLRTEMRGVRESAAASARNAIETVPDIAPFEIDDQLADDAPQELTLQ